MKNDQFHLTFHKLTYLVGINIKIRIPTQQCQAFCSLSPWVMLGRFKVRGQRSNGGQIWKNVTFYIFFTLSGPTSLPHSMEFQFGGLSNYPK